MVTRESLYTAVTNSRSWAPQAHHPGPCRLHYIMSYIYPVSRAHIIAQQKGRQAALSYTLNNTLEHCYPGGCVRSVLRHVHMHKNNAGSMLLEWDCLLSHIQLSSMIINQGHSWASGDIVSGCTLFIYSRPCQEPAHQQQHMKEAAVCIVISLVGFGHAVARQSKEAAVL